MTPSSDALFRFGSRAVRFFLRTLLLPSPFPKLYRVAHAPPFPFTTLLLRLFRLKHSCFSVSLMWCIEACPGHCNLHPSVLSLASLQRQFAVFISCIAALLILPCLTSLYPTNHGEVPQCGGSRAAGTRPFSPLSGGCAHGPFFFFFLFFSPRRHCHIKTRIRNVLTFDSRVVFLDSLGLSCLIDFCLSEPLLEHYICSCVISCLPFFSLS